MASAFSTRQLLALLCVLTLLPVARAQNPQAQPQAAKPEQPAPKLSNDQIDSLVAPIALYADPLLSQVLVASTYPLELVECSQWLTQNKDKKGQALVDAAKKQDWDPSVQAMVAFPDLVGRLSKDIKWTTDLGNAFLAQQQDVMDAVQRMRKKAQEKGSLKSNEQQKVETKTEEGKQVIVVQPANPEVIYVPTYNPTVVYPPPVYPYPPIYYPPPPPAGAIIATSMISFGVGVAVGAMFSGGWGWGCGWGHNTVIVNNNYFVRNNYNNFNRNVNINQNINRNVNVNQNWSHNPAHRAGVPYSNRNLANEYHGVARQDVGTARGREQQARVAQQNLQSRQGNLGQTRQPGNLSQPRQTGERNLGSSGNHVGGRDLGSTPHNTSALSGVDRGGSRAHASANRGYSGMNSARSSGFHGGGRGGGGFRRR